MLPALANTVQAEHYVGPSSYNESYTAHKELQQIDSEQCHTPTHPQLGTGHQ